MTGALLVVGELNVDLIVLVGDEILFGQHEQIVPSTTMTMGSSSAITACGAARLGIATSLVSVRGDDPFGTYLAEELTARGVDGSAVRIDPTLPTGSSVHLSRADGDRAILTAMGSIGAVGAADVPEALLARHAHLHVGSYFLQRDLWPDAVDLFRRARRLGLRVSLDGNFDPSGAWDSGILELLREVDVFFGNEQEICGIARIEDLGVASRLLLERMPEGALLVQKRGADGASVLRNDADALSEWHARPPALPAPIVDTVGAGDSLAAGFVASLLQGAAPESALATGVACGSASTQAAGGVDGQADATLAASLAARVAVTRRSRVP